MAPANTDPKNEAYSLYVSGGESLEAVAEKTGTSLSTLKNWSSQNGWAKDKKEFEEAMFDGHQSLVAAQGKLSSKVRAGDRDAIFTLLKLRKELRHEKDPNAAIAEFATALITDLENDGHSGAAGLVASYLEAAAKKVVD